MACPYPAGVFFLQMNSVSPSRTRVSRTRDHPKRDDVVGFLHRIKEQRGQAMPNSADTYLYNKNKQVHVRDNFLGRAYYSACVCMLLSCVCTAVLQAHFESNNRGTYTEVRGLDGARHSCSLGPVCPPVLLGISRRYYSSLHKVV